MRTQSHCRNGACRGGHHHTWHGCGGQNTGVPARWQQQEHHCRCGSWDSSCGPKHHTPNVGLYAAPPELYEMPPVGAYEMPPAEAPDATSEAEDSKIRSNSIDKLTAVVEHLAAKITVLEKKLEEKEETK